MFEATYLEGEGLGHLHGLADATALDQQVVILLLRPRQADHLRQEVLPQRAADAACQVAMAGMVLKVRNQVERGH